MGNRFCKGLGIIDFSIIVMLLAMLLGVIYWRYDDFACRAMQSEAKFSLSQIHAAQLLYHSEHDQYASLETLLEIEKRLVLPQKYFHFSDLVEPQKDIFSIKAEGHEHTLVAGELWVVDQQKNIINKIKVCKK